MNGDSNQPKINPWIIAIAVILPTFIEVLDTTVVSVALNNIAGNLSATISQATWVQTGYLISNAIILPAAAWFSALFGRKRFLMVCVGIFTVASFACGAAPNLSFLIFASIVQGAGGGALQPISQAVLMESFPPAKRGVAMAAYVVGVVVAPVVEPVIGGWLTDNYSWRWIFYINIPCGLVALWMIQQFVFDPKYIRDLKPGRIDAFGFLVLAIWLGTLQTVLNKGQDEDWFNSNFICTLSVISVIAFIAFVIREFSIREPLADLRVFADRNFLSCSVLVGDRLSPFVWDHEPAAAHGGKPHGLHRLHQRTGASAARPGRIGLHAAGGNHDGESGRPSSDWPGNDPDRGCFLDDGQLQSGYFQPRLFLAQLHSRHGHGASP